MLNWLFSFIDNALNSEPTTLASSSCDSISHYFDHSNDFERFDNFGCGAPFQVSAEASYLTETRSHDFTATTYGDSLSSDWSSSSFESSSVGSICD